MLLLPEEPPHVRFVQQRVLGAPGQAPLLIQAPGVMFLHQLLFFLAPLCSPNSQVS